MEMKQKKTLFLGIGLVIAFIIWTCLILTVDVQPLGQNGTNIGFATVNTWFHKMTGVHMGIYVITDWLGLVPVFVCMGFGILGLIQWIKRKSIRKVDFDILVLGGFYIVTIAAYLFFENVVINYRPVLINGYLEASYPSSTTMMVMCVMLTAIIQLCRRIRNKAVRNIISVIFVVFITFMVISRLLSGVHWFTDIVGGALLSTGLVLMYHAII